MTAQQLKNSILQMAVQGKLVPQDPNDEPASVLLERIRAEKEQLIREKKIKQVKNSSVIFRGADNIPYEKVGDKVTPLEVPFEIPESWEWVRIRSLGEIIRGNGIKRTETTASGMPCVRYGELYTTYQTSFTETVSFIPESIYNACKHFSYGDILMTLTGENKPDIAKAVAYMGNKPVAAGGDLAFWTRHGMNPLFLSYLMASPYVINRKVALATGDIIVHISGDKLGNILIPVPPSNEQVRIVGQIFKAEIAINEYSIKENELQSLQASFQDRLKRSILQQAVQGKLVSQDPADEPARVLLERIRMEKQRLVKESKIKKDKYESVIFRRDNSHYEIVDGVERCIDEELPFEIPENWVWTRVKNICEYIADCPHSTPKYYAENTGYYCIDTTCIESDGRIAKFRYVDQFAYFNRTVRLVPRENDIVYTREGSIGRAAMLPPVENICLGQRVMLLRFSKQVNVRLYQYILMSPFVIDTITSKTRGIGAKHINVSDVCNAIIPIPPIADQRRIVAKIEELLPLIQSI